MSFLKFVSSKYFLRQLILALLLVGLFVFIVFKSLGMITHHSEKIEVPDLSEKTMDEVANVLGDMSLKYVVQDSSEYNPEYPRRSVIRQEPKSGDIVKSGRKIYLTLNASGYRLIAVPKFLGKTKRNVESTFKAVGFKINPEFVYVPDMGKNVVRGVMFNGKKIKAGDSIPKRSQLTLVLGNGRGGATDD